jgi:hypothetical protein
LSGNALGKRPKNGSLASIIFLTQWREEECLPPDVWRLEKVSEEDAARLFASSLTFEQHPERKMFYIDKNSLYPTVAIKEEYPVGRARL